MQNVVTIIINGKPAEIQFPDSLMRDYFAAAVAAGLIVREGYHQETTTNEGTALKSFRMADAMLAARERKSP